LANSFDGEVGLSYYASPYAVSGNGLQLTCWYRSALTKYKTIIIIIYYTLGSIDPEG